MNLAVLGGGQLGRMLGLAGLPLGVRCTFLDPSASCCASAVGRHVCAPFDDGDAIARVTDGAAAVTYEFENVPVVGASHAAQHAPLRPGVRSLEVAQDRLSEKTLFRECGIPVQAFASMASERDAALAIERVGTRGMLKTRRNGYDGKGQCRLVDATPASLADAWASLGRVPCIYEALVPFTEEISIVATRGRIAGTISFAAYAPCVNVHRDGILSTTRAVPDHPLACVATAHVERLMAELDHIGTMAVEFFVVNGSLVANEMAPRVHNSAHWTIDGAATSQFENHLRAVLGLPLGDTRTLGHAAMVNLVGAIPEVSALAAVPDVHIHLYGKSSRPGRKVGHVNVRSDSAEACERTIATLLAIVARTTGR